MYVTLDLIEILFFFALLIHTWEIMYSHRGFLLLLFSPFSQLYGCNKVFGDSKFVSSVL